jgi:hypothetical protein
MSTITASPSTSPSSLSKWDQIYNQFDAIMSRQILSALAIDTYCAFLDRLMRLSKCGFVHNLPLDHFRTLQIRGPESVHPQ